MDGGDDLNPFQGHQGLDGNNPDGDAPAQNQAAARNDDDGRMVVRDQDRTQVPIASIARIMRRALPSHAKISDDAKERIQACISEYIGLITGEANERCQGEQRKIITAEDLIWAMAKLGFDDYVGPLTTFLQRYREAEGAGSSRVSSSRDPLPISRRSGSATGLLPMLPTATGMPIPMPMPMSVPVPVPMPMMPMPMPVPMQIEPDMDGLSQQQLNMSPLAGMNVGLDHYHQQQQQPGVYDDPMAEYYFSGYGDGTNDESSSGQASCSFDPIPPPCE